MPKAVFIRRGDGMFPVDDDGRDMVRACAEGRQVMGEFRGARNPRHHRMFFALLKMLVENTEPSLFAGDTELARKAILTDCRECDLWVHPKTGEVRVEVRSMAFEKMDQARFTRLFNRALYVICSDYLGGADMEDVREQIYEIVDGPERASIGRRVA
jgi:hypothetical protein